MNNRVQEVREHAPRLSVVVPCYNEESCIAELVRRTTAACQNAVESDYELVLVNDGSTDATWVEINAAAQADPHVVGVNLSRNHGHQLALSAGLTICTGENILILDADLQDPPELLGQMLAKAGEGFDVVYGKRRVREGEGLFKRLSAAFFYRLLSRMTDVAIPVDTGDFRLMSRRALNVLIDMPEHHRFIRGMVSWIGYPQTAVEYDRDKRYSGYTKYPLRKMIKFAFDAITGFSTEPLRLASRFGFLLAIISVLLMFYILISYLSGETVQGWTSLMAVVVLLGSVQMFVLGIMGEYLGRLYIEAKGRPLFIIQDVVRARDTWATDSLANSPYRSTEGPKALARGATRPEIQ